MQINFTYSFPPLYNLIYVNLMSSMWLHPSTIFSILVWSILHTCLSIKLLHYNSLCDMYCVQSCLTLCNLGSSVHGTPQARTLEWVAMSSSGGSSRPRGGARVPCIPCIGSRFFSCVPPGFPRSHTYSLAIPLNIKMEM